MNPDFSVCGYFFHGNQFLDIQLFNNGGNSLDLSLPITDRALFHIDNVYHIPNVCRTN